MVFVGSIYSSVHSCISPGVRRFRRRKAVGGEVSNSNRQEEVGGET
jgi:hypothetical protein